MLLDTCVLSELVKPRPAPAVVSWFEAAADPDLHVSVLTLGEIAKGARRLPTGAKRARIETWLAQLRTEFADRIVGVNDETAILWGRLAAEAEKRGRSLTVVDGLLAATAIHLRMPLVTRNVDDFKGIALSIINPWDSRPAAG